MFYGLTGVAESKENDHLYIDYHTYSHLLQAPSTVNHTKPENYGDFNLKTHQLFSVIPRRRKAEEGQQ